jgi:hypothetical protein
MTKKNNIYFLVFDDDPAQDKIIESRILANLKEFEVEYDLINPKEFVDLESSSFKEEEFRDSVFQKTKGKTINVIASDCNLIKIDEFIFQGIDLISILLAETRKNYNCPFILYSGKAKEASVHIINKIKQATVIDLIEEDSDINSISVLKNLMQARINFSGRNEDSYCDEIVKVIKSELSINDIILSSFSKFGLTTVQTGNSDYDGKSLDELLSLIDQKDVKGQRFVKEFIELSIAHYTNLNV